MKYPVGYVPLGGSGAIGVPGDANVTDVWSIHAPAGLGLPSEPVATLLSDRGWSISAIQAGTAPYPDYYIIVCCPPDAIPFHAGEYEVRYWDADSDLESHARPAYKLVFSIIASSASASEAPGPVGQHRGPILRGIDSSVVLVSSVQPASYSGSGGGGSQSGSPSASGSGVTSPSASPSASPSPSPSASASPSGSFSSSSRNTVTSSDGGPGCTVICAGDSASVALALDCIDCPGFSPGDWYVLNPSGDLIANQADANGWTAEFTSPVPPIALVGAPADLTPGTYSFYICSSSGGSGVACYGGDLCIINCSASSGGGGGSGSSSGSGGHGGSSSHTGSASLGSDSFGSGWCDYNYYFPFPAQPTDKFLIPSFGPLVYHPGLTLPTNAGPLPYRLYGPNLYAIAGGGGSGPYFRIWGEWGVGLRASWPLLLKHSATPYDEVTVQREDGTCMLYQVSEPGSSMYVSMIPRVFDTLKHNTDTDSSWDELRFETGTTFHYPAGDFSSLAYFQTITGQEVQFGYNDYGNLYLITDPTGRKIQIAFTDDQLVETVQDWAGRELQFEYTEDSLLQSVTDPAGGITTYALWEPDSGQTYSIQAPDGKLTTYCFNPSDGSGFQIQRDSGVQDYNFTTVDESTTKVVFVDEFSNEWTTLVDDDILAITSVTDPLEATRSALYGFPQEYPVNLWDALNHVSSMTYDENGRMTVHTNPLGQTVSQSFDSFGNRLWMQDSLGQYTSFSYFGGGSTRQLETKTDALGGQTQYTYSDWGALASVTTPLSRTTSYNWAEDGTLSSRTDEFSNSQYYYYDDAGNQTRMVDELNRNFYFGFDGMDRPIVHWNDLGEIFTIQYDGVNPYVTIDPLGARTTTLFNGLNQPVQVQDANGYMWTTVYSNEGIVELEQDPLNNATSYVTDGANNLLYAYDALGRITQTDHDLAQQLICTVAPDLSRTTMSYDLAGRLQSVMAPAGQITTTIRDEAGQPIATLDCLNLLHTTAYDALGRVEMTIAPTGAINTLLWDADSRPIGHIDALGRRTTITYTPGVPQVVTQDPLGRLATVMHDASGAALYEQSPSGRTASYAYNAAARLQNTIDYLGLISTIQYDLAGQPIGHEDALGLRVTDVYNPVGQITAHIDVLSNRYTNVYDPARRHVVTIDPLGARTTQTWSAANELLQTQDALGYSSINTFSLDTGQLLETFDQTGAGTIFWYDQYGRHNSTTDPDGFTSTVLFDQYGRQCGVQNARNFIVTALFDQYNRPIGHLDALGGITSLTLDLADRTVAVQNALGYRTSTTYNALDQVTQTIDASNYYTTVVYDSRANQSEVITPNGDISTVQYDGYSRPIAHIGESGGRSTTVYDSYGRVWFESTPNGPGVTSVYDAYNRHWSEIKYDGSRVTNVYDSLGRVQITLDEKGFGVTNSYDALWRVYQQMDPGGGMRTTTYSGRGEVIQTQDENSFATNYLFDGRGHHIGTTLPGSTGWTSQVYDQVGNRIADVSNAGRYTYSFDARNLYIGHTNPIGKYDVLTLDAIGQKSVYQAPDGTLCTYIHDPVGNIGSQISHSSGRVTYLWDGMHNLLGSEDRYGNYTYTYAGAHRLATAAAPGQTSPISYIYDLNHNLTQSTAPWGASYFEYDPLDQLALATDTGYLAGGIAPGITSYTRDERGLITGQSNSNGTNSAFSFDGNRRVTFVNHTEPGGGTLLQIGYTHDAAGNPLTKSTSNGDYVYQYDENNQLVYEETPTGFTSLTYDGSFRRIQQLDALGLTEFTYNDAGQLLYSTGARPATCTYDDNGNTTSIHTLAGLTSYAWDDLGRLSGATVPGNKILTMTYRFDHLLSSKTGPNGTQQLLWDGQNVATASGPASAALPAAAGCVFLGTDTTTQGNWMGVYGADGYNIIEDTVDYPSYLSFSQTGGVDYIFAYSTTDVRALERVLGGRRAAEWFNDTTFTLNMNFTDGKPHKVSIYCLDWDATTTTQTVAIVDANSGVELNSQYVSGFHDGIYLSWILQGHIKMVFTSTNPSLQCRFSGFMFDPPPATCLFIGSDTTTQGNWQGAYGADGYNIIQDAVSYPSYATVSETGTSNNTWSTTTTDVRALEQTITGRIAADWYSATTFTVDINLTDGNPHKVSIYCLDWDETTRTQTVAVLDAVSGTVLNTQDLNTSFNGGIYLSWTIRGHVQLVFTNTNMTYNAVVSGLFFDSFPTAPTGGYGVVAAGAGLTRSIGVDSNGYPVVRQYHTDGQGSVLAITDGLGNVVTGYQIDAWGNVLYGGAPGNAFDYLGGLGYWADPDLSLHYVRARWMNPAFGNWLSVDPHLDEFAYQYANNMPTTGSDPSGKDPASDRALAEWKKSQLARQTLSADLDVRRAAVTEWLASYPGEHLPTRNAASQVPTPKAHQQQEHQGSSAAHKGTPAGPKHGPGTAAPPPDPTRMAGESPEHLHQRMRAAAALRAQFNDVEHNRTMDYIRAGAGAGASQLGHELLGIGKAAAVPVLLITAGAGLVSAGVISVPVATAGGVGFLAYSAGASIHSRFEEARGYHKRTGKHQSSGRVVAAGISDMFGVGGLYTGSTNRSLLTDEYLGLSQDELAETYGGGLGTGLTWAVAGQLGRIGSRAGSIFAARHGGSGVSAAASAMHAPGDNPLVLKMFTVPRTVSIEDAAGTNTTMILPKRGEGVVVDPALFTMDQLQQLLGHTGDEFEMGNIEPDRGRPYMRLSRGGPARVTVPEVLLNSVKRYDPIGHGHFHETNPSLADVRTQAARSSRFGDTNRGTQGRTLGYHEIGLPSGATFRDINVPGTNVYFRIRTASPGLKGAAGHFEITSPKDFTVRGYTNVFYEIKLNGETAGQVTVDPRTHEVIDVHIYSKYVDVIR